MGSLCSTDLVPPQERLGFWQEMIRNSYVSLEVELNSDRPFYGALDFESLGAVDISELHSCGQQVKRTEDAIIHSENDYFFILAQLEGSGIIAQDSYSTKLKRGGWVLVDSTRPYQFSLEQDFRQLVVSIPRSSLPLLSQQSHYMTGRDLSQLLSLGDVVSNYLLSLSRQMRNILPESRVLLAESVINLLCAALNETLATQKETNNTSVIHLERIKSFILRHLDEADLSVGMLARELNISKRYVHKLFSSMDTTVAEYIRNSRLENCRRELISSANINKSITQIAFSWGFNSAAHFSYLFKQQYQMSASEYRKQHIHNNNTSH